MLLLLDKDKREEKIKQRGLHGSNISLNVLWIMFSCSQDTNQCDPYTLARVSIKFHKCYCPYTLDT